jgi:hypothetical protein
MWFAGGNREPALANPHAGCPAGPLRSGGVRPGRGRQQDRGGGRGSQLPALRVPGRGRRDQGQLCTEISDSLSGEINAHYARLFRFFQARPELALTPPFRRAILSHLPAILREEPRFRQRLAQLPPKYRSAILAAEIGSSLVYRGDREAEFEDMIRLHLTRNFPAEPEA